MNKTAIEYLTHTWNPIAMRCTPVSEGCANCWHLAMCKRHAKNPNFTPEVRAAYAGGPPVLLADRLEAPLHRREHAMIGVQFMGDLFHEDVSFTFQTRVWYAMRNAEQHAFLVLTKRPANLLEFYRRTTDYPFWPLGHIWLGITVENQATADERIPLLMQTPAAVRFVSIEPMLGPINIAPYLGQVHADSLGLPYKGDDPWYSGIDWVICGGEAGPGARPMAPGWARALRDDCQAAGVPFFFKQWGEWAACGYARMGLCPTCSRKACQTVREPPSLERVTRVGKKAAGRLLDGRKWEQCPETHKPPTQESTHGHENLEGRH